MVEAKGKAGKPRRTKAAKPAPGATTTRAPRKAAARRSAPPAEREERVRIAAYLRAERRGFAPGWEVEDWLAAEAEVNAAAALAAGARKAARKSRTG